MRLPSIATLARQISTLAFASGLGLTVLQAAAQPSSPPHAPPVPMGPPPLLGVLAAGSASAPPSLTAVTQGQRAILDTVQPLHPGARPLFQGLRLGPLAEQSFDGLLGWQRATGEVVLVPRAALAAAPPPAPAPAAAPERRLLRYVQRPQDLRVAENDQVLVVMTINGVLAMPDPALANVRDGHALTIKLMGAGARLVVNNVDNASIVLEAGHAVDLVASAPLRTWLLLGRL